MASTSDLSEGNYEKLYLLKPDKFKKLLDDQQTLMSLTDLYSKQIEIYKGLLELERDKAKLYNEMIEDLSKHFNWWEKSKPWITFLLGVGLTILTVYAVGHLK